MKCMEDDLMIPQIDSQIGILLYTTKFDGCGGQIRTHEEDFIVDEILSEKSKNSIKERDGYAVYKLKKQRIDTHHALEFISKKTGLRLKALGLKDASAITEQYVCTDFKSRAASDFSSEKCSLAFFGYAKKPLSKKDMVGNNFKIKITNANSDISKFTEYDKILNFFGYQRFGSKRPVNHLVGKAILQKDFDSAISLLLSYTSEYDSQENTEIRKKMADQNNLSKIYDEIPSKMDFEKKIVEELINSNDNLKALRKIPLNIRRMFVQSYQSYLFNKTISMAYAAGEDLFLPKDGDVCYDINGMLGKYVKDPKQRLTVPLIGHSYYKKTRFDYYISKILQEELIEPKQFFIKEMQELSTEGGFRNSAIHCTDVKATGDTISFTLNRGSFATIVMREIMKPENPILAGF